MHKWAVARRQKAIQTAERDRKAQGQSLEAKRSIAATELANLTTLRVRDLLGDAEFLERRREVELTLRTVEQRLENMKSAEQRFEPPMKLISFNESLVSRYAEADIQMKRLILTTVGSNLRLVDKKLSIDACKPFRRWPENSNSSTMRAFVEDIRTFFAVQRKESLQMHARIKDLLADSTPLSKAA